MCTNSVAVAIHVLVDLVRLCSSVRSFAHSRDPSCQIKGSHIVEEEWANVAATLVRCTRSAPKQKLELRENTHTVSSSIERNMET